MIKEGGRKGCGKISGKHMKSSCSARLVATGAAIAIKISQNLKNFPKLYYLELIACSLAVSPYSGRAAKENSH